MANRVVIIGALVGGFVKIAVADACGAEPGATCEGPDVFAVIGVGTDGLAFGGVSRVGDAAPSRGLPWTLQFGERLGRGLYLTEELDTLDDLAYSPDPSAGDSRATILAGVEWFPFGASPRRNPLHFPRYLDANAWYLKASLGYEWRDRTSMMLDTVTSAPVVAAHLGALPFQGTDWAFGYEFREQLEHYREGFQRSWALSAVVQLHN